MFNVNSSNSKTIFSNNSFKLIVFLAAFAFSFAMITGTGMASEVGADPSAYEVPSDCDKVADEDFSDLQGKIETVYGNGGGTVCADGTFAGDYLKVYEGVTLISQNGRGDATIEATVEVQGSNVTIDGLEIVSDKGSTIQVDAHENDFKGDDYSVLSNVKVQNNIINNTGWTGIHTKDANNDEGRVEDLVIQNNNITVDASSGEDSIGVRLNFEGSTLDQSATIKNNTIDVAEASATDYTSYGVAVVKGSVLEGQKVTIGLNNLSACANGIHVGGDNAEGTGINSNHLVNSGDDVVNDATDHTLDANNNYWGTDGIKVSGDVTYTPWFATPDFSRDVEVYDSSDNIKAYSGTIQDAVEAAKSGDTIKVSEGTYEENIVVASSLAESGDLSDLTITNADGASPEIVFEPSSSTGIEGVTALDANDAGNLATVEIYAPGVTFEGIDVTRNAADNRGENSGFETQGITVRNSGVTIQDVNVDTDLGAETGNNNYGVFMSNEGEGDTSEVKLDNVKFNNFETGVLIADYYENGNAISGVTLTDVTTSDYHLNGLNVYEVNGGIESDAITGSNNDFTGGVDGSGQSIVLTDAADAVSLNGPVQVEEGDSIQTAVDVAASGATVEVAAGTYNPDNIVVNKTGLTVQFESGVIVSQSSGIDDSLNGFITIEAENVVMESIHGDSETPAKLKYTADDYYPVIEIQGTGAKLRGFDVVRNNGDEALAVRASDVVVSDNEITGDASEGIKVTNPWNPDVSWNPDHSDDNTANVTVAENTVDGLTKGIVVRSRRDLVDDDGTTKEEYQGSVKNITVQGNTIQNNEVGILGATESDRSLTVETPQDVTIMGNEIKSNQIGLEFDSIEGAEGFDTGQVTVEGNLITGPTTMTGIQISATDVTDNGEGLEVVGNEFANTGDVSTGENYALHINSDGVTDVEFRENNINGYRGGVFADNKNIHNLLVEDNSFDIPAINITNEGDDNQNYIGYGVQLWHGNNLQVKGNQFVGSLDEMDESLYEEPTENLINHYAVVSWTAWFINNDNSDWPEVDGDVYIEDNEMSNIYLGASAFAATNGEIMDNNIHDNYVGIQVGQTDNTYATEAAKGLAIEENDIVDNTRGIWVQNFVEDGMHASYNNITGNELGINNTAGHIFDATRNYWGHPTGPSRMVDGEWIGEGDNVSENVSYKPWLPVPWAQQGALEISPASPSVTRGNSQAFSAYIKDGEGETVDVTDKVEWSIVGDSAGSEISNNVVTTDSVGSTNVQAKYNFTETGDYEIFANETLTATVSLTAEGKTHDIDPSEDEEEEPKPEPQPEPEPEPESIVEEATVNVETGEASAEFEAGEGQTVSVEVPETGGGEGISSVESVSVTSASSQSISVTTRTVERDETNVETRDNQVGFEEINVEGEVEEGTVTFSVGKNVLDERGAEPEDVVKERYNPDTEEWEELDTSVLEEQGDRFRFEAEVPQFSLFATSIDVQTEETVEEPTAEEPATEAPGITGRIVESPAVFTLGVIAVILLLAYGTYSSKKESKGSSQKVPQKR